MATEAAPANPPTDTPAVAPTGDPAAPAAADEPMVATAAAPAAAAAIAMASVSDMKAAFKELDAGAKGTISADELKAILMSGKIPLSEVDCDWIIGDLDPEKKGVLSMSTFIPQFCGVEPPTESRESRRDDPSHDPYNAAVEPFQDQIKQLFEALDADNSGSLDGAEMKRVVEVYSGETFVEEDFLSWYDSNGDSEDGEFDLTEFGWYIADCAECNLEKMEATIQSFKEAIEYVSSQQP